MSLATAYDELTAKLRHAHLLGTVGELLDWDEQVNLPGGGASQRAEQMAALAEAVQATAADPRIGASLTELEANAAKLTVEQTAVVRHARRDYDRATKLPFDFVREKAAHSSHAYHAWAEAREKSAFSAFAPFLEKHLELARREAALLGWGDRPYDYCIDQYDPGMTSATIERLFAELQTGLTPIARAILSSPLKAVRTNLQRFPEGAQQALLRDVTEQIGFDYRHGRIDVSLHPFCSGTGADIRMTTRFDTDNPLNSLFSAIHETGHGLYEQGLPREPAGTALTQAAGMAVHESQSRLWENQVARSRAFWRYFEPKWRRAFPAQSASLSSDDLYLAINAVKPTLIRVEADEVTYNLHIILRFDLERRLFAGELAVRDLPAAWNPASNKLLGLTPSCDREGVLQDVHWSSGSFGYFPSYCLGNMLAAQLWEHALAALPGLEDDFAHGEFGRLLGWLRSTVHAHGRRYDVLDLTRHATGTDLSPLPLLRYLRDHYAPLYLS